MAYSQDDRFLVTLGWYIAKGDEKASGDYVDRVLALWNTQTYDLTSSTRLAEPVHDLAFNPLSVGQLACVGKGAVTFWLMKQQGSDISLKVQRVPAPDAIGGVELTSMCYSSGCLLYTGTSTGQICSWDTETNCCFMTWEAVDGEIGMELSPHNQETMSSILCSGRRKLVFCFSFSQVFIGHSEPIQQVRFTADQKQVFSVGDAIFLWDFLGVFAEETFRDEIDSPRPLALLPVDANLEKVQNSPPGSSDAPRQLVPLPTVVSPPCLDLSALHRLVEHDTWSDSEEEKEACLKGKHGEAVNGTTGHSVLVLNDVVQHEEPLAVKPDLTPICSSPHSPAGGDRGKETKGSLPQNIIRPDCYRHFIPRFKSSAPSKVFSSPTANEGLKLKAVIGYNGNARGNMVWNPDTGFFAYSCGCVLIVEDLHSGSQQHWLGHPEEISTLALSHNAQVWSPHHFSIDKFIRITNTLVGSDEMGIH
ncbi:PREDICTED: WD repeat-containing protein 90-like [Thamnophis sirtalis]|uniref:WD repeat-containing protein 90-like n=1 Tax=Thamnophis sirtalis TaxID=35019 RepID=A0A6I9YFE5_9SAUR|nr:PREDICTED: WD repeat-containing protein 90-like [Thamnophis sirtalis]